MDVVAVGLPNMQVLPDFGYADYLLHDDQ